VKVMVGLYLMLISMNTFNLGIMSIDRLYNSTIILIQIFFRLQVEAEEEASIHEIHPEILATIDDRVCIWPITHNTSNRMTCSH